MTEVSVSNIPSMTYHSIMIQLTSKWRRMLLPIGGLNYVLFVQF